MNDEHVFWSRRLDEYLDGDLDSAGAEEVESHLATCPACRSELAGLESLREVARSLPHEITPGRELWAEIERRIGPPMADAEVPARAPAVARPWQSQRRWLVAAAAVLVMVSSAVTALLLRDAAEPPRAAVEPRPVGLAAFASTEVEFESAVASLRRDLEAARPRLQPETVAAVEQNLEIIDQAILEARSALAADPLNADLPHLLSGVYRQKVELLRTAVSLGDARS